MPRLWCSLPHFARGSWVYVESFRLLASLPCSQLPVPIASELIDLAYIGNGGRAVHVSDQHYGRGENLILPGRGVNMGDGMSFPSPHASPLFSPTLLSLRLGNQTFAPSCPPRYGHDPAGPPRTLDGGHDRYVSFQGQFPRECGHRRMLVRRRGAPPRDRMDCTDAADKALGAQGTPSDTTKLGWSLFTCSDNDLSRRRNKAAQGIRTTRCPRSAKSSDNIASVADKVHPGGSPHPRSLCAIRPSDIIYIPLFAHDQSKPEHRHENSPCRRGRKSATARGTKPRDKSSGTESVCVSVRTTSDPSEAKGFGET